MSDLTNGQYQQLIKSIGDCLANGRQSAMQQVNRALVETYWNIGRYIVEFEQQGQEKAEYGSRLLAQLSKDLRQRHGKGLAALIYSTCGFYIWFIQFTRHCLAN